MKVVLLKGYKFLIFGRISLLGNQKPISCFVDRCMHNALFDMSLRLNCKTIVIISNNKSMQNKSQTPLYNNLHAIKIGAGLLGNKMIIS